MTTRITMNKLGGNLINHPDLRELVLLVAESDPLFVKESEDDRGRSVVISGSDRRAIFTFLEQANGDYTMVRNQ